MAPLVCYALAERNEMDEDAQTLKFPCWFWALRTLRSHWSKSEPCPLIGWLSNICRRVTFLSSRVEITWLISTEFDRSQQWQRPAPGLVTVTIIIVSVHVSAVSTPSSNISNQTPWRTWRTSKSQQAIHSLNCRNDELSKVSYFSTLQIDR